MRPCLRCPRRLFPLLLLALLPAGAAEPAPAGERPVLFNTAFEGASLGRIEKLGPGEFRLHLEGQQDARGRNRQATWIQFRLDQVSGRELTLRFTSFKGEYNDRPANSPTGAWYRPVVSEDGETWRHVESAVWDERQDEITLRVRPRGTRCGSRMSRPIRTSGCCGSSTRSGAGRWRGWR